MNLITFSFLDYAFPNQLGFQAPASPLMIGLIEIHHQIMFYLIFIIVFVFSMLFLILQAFSIKNIYCTKNFFKIRSLYDIDIRHNSILEIIWTIIPAIFLYLIALPSFNLLYGFELFMDSNMSVKIIGNQWYWSYETVLKLKSWPALNDEAVFFKNVNINFDSYMVSSQDLKQNELRLLETTNALVLPIKTYIRAYASASDVLHSWAVPSLAIKVDCIPGRLNEVMIYINRIGRFYGQCSEICGVNHGFMPITVYGINKFDYIIYCALASNDLTSYLFCDFFFEDSFLNYIFMWHTKDFISGYPSKINNFFFNNFNKNFVNIIEKI